MKICYKYGFSLCHYIGTAVLILFAINPTLGQDAVFVTKQGCPDPDGSSAKPYHTIASGISHCKLTSASELRIAPGKYYENLMINQPCKLLATTGKVTIGKLDYQAKVDFEVLTLNTHLAGDQIAMPSWKDKARAYDIAHFFGNTNLWPDVVGFQEIWDEDLFFGGDGAAGILPMTGYFDGKHGSDNLGHGANSGLAIMSKYSLTNFAQFPWWAPPAPPICAGVDCLANKGWITTTINKEGFNIRLFVLHTQADEHPEVRAAQLNLLKNVIELYRNVNPRHVVFVIGDYNVFGETQEYNNNLIPIIGKGAGGFDADRNDPSFIPKDETTFTVCDCNQLAKHFDPETSSGRLDYIFYFPSKDGQTEVIPLKTKVIPFIGRMLSSDDGLTTNQSSDHWSLYGKFRLIRK